MIIKMQSMKSIKKSIESYICESATANDTSSSRNASVLILWERLPLMQRRELLIRLKDNFVRIRFIVTLNGSSLFSAT